MPTRRGTPNQRPADRACRFDPGQLWVCCDSVEQLVTTLVCLHLMLMDRARGCERGQKHPGRRACGHRLPRICSTRGCCRDIEAGTSRKPRGITAPTRPIGWNPPGFSRGEDVNSSITHCARVVHVGYRPFQPWRRCRAKRHTEFGESAQLVDALLLAHPRAVAGVVGRDVTLYLLRTQS